MIGFAVGIVLGLIVAAFIWLHMHHSAKLEALETDLRNDAQGYWRDLVALEERLVAKIDGKQDTPAA